MAKMTAFVERFDGTSLDPRWSNLWGAASVIAVAGGQAAITIDTVYDYVIVPNESYDLTDSSIVWNFSSWGTAAASDFTIGVTSGQSNTSPAVQVVTTKDKWLRIEQITTAGGALTTVLQGQAPIDAKYVRLREAAGTMFCDTSADGATWSVFHSWTTPFVMTDMRPFLLFGKWDAAQPDSVVVLDGINDLAVAEPPPAVPTGLTVTAVSSTRLDLSWSAAQGATGYDVERDGTVLSTDVQGVTYSDTGLTATTTYTYRVRARKVA